MDEKRDVSAVARDVTTHGKATAESMLELTRAVLLSAVGAAGSAMDEARALLDKLVERGEIAEKDARRLMDDVAHRAERQTQPDQLESESQLAAVLHRLGVPSNADIARLNTQLAVLSAKIDELIAYRAGQAAEQPPRPPLQP